MKAVILARVSTKDQELFGHSLEAQVVKLREYAKRNSFEVVKIFSFSETAGHKIRKKFEEMNEANAAEHDQESLIYHKTKATLDIIYKQTIDPIVAELEDITNSNHKNIITAYDERVASLTKQRDEMLANNKKSYDTAYESIILPISQQYHAECDKLKSEMVSKDFAYNKKQKDLLNELKAISKAHGYSCRIKKENKNK